MICYRRACLSIALLCFCAAVASTAWGQNPPAPQQPAPAPPPAQETKPQNPFETVPESQTKPGQTQQPPLETPKPAEQPKVQPGGQVIEDIQFRGQRRVPVDTMRALISTKKGDIYNEEDLHRDFMALWNSGHFDDIHLETEPAPGGGVILRYIITERRVVRSIKYGPGLKSLTVSEILDRFKERKVGLSVESQYDPNKVQHAAVVIKEYLAERGRQFATVQPEVRQIPPSSLEVFFNVNEGPKIKVGQITVVGNQAFSQRDVIRAMVNTHDYGIPHSILFENIFARTFDSSKLDEDKERVRDAYQSKGYFTAKVLDQKTELVNTGGHGFKLPLIKSNNPGKAMNITLPVEEGRLYRLNKITFVGVKLFRTPETLMRPLFGMAEGDPFSTTKLRKGLENLRKLYGEFGYIDFVPEPNFDVIPNTDKVDLTLTADEGKQFFVRRIDFSGNVTTRDKIIRREILLDEGDIFNNRLWELSILRLNQLGYFEALKAEESADIKRNTQTSTVDITLKVKERGKNTIGLNGGVSGIAGSFVGLNYATNNFLGLGDTLSINSQLGTRMRSVSTGFTEPYFLDLPVQVGVEAHLTRFDYNQGREASILAGENLIPLFNALGSQNLLNYIQTGHGFSVSGSYPLKRSFSRLGITYGYDISDVKTETTAASSYFDYINFSGIAGPNALQGIRTSRIVPSFTYNTVNHPITPTGGKSLFISTTFAGSFLGGNVNTIQPVIEGKYFKPAPWHKSNILAFHLLASMITGYGGKEIPPFSRTYIGGEQDIRGFQIWGISPIAFIPSEATINVLNNDGSQRTALVNTYGTLTATPVTMNVPIYQLAFPGGDTRVVGNFEYRIPIFGPVVLAIFADAGIDRILRPGELDMAPARVDYLNDTYPTAGFEGKALVYPGTQRPRMSTGLELQVLLPVVQAPFRVYWAYNPLLVREYLQPPIPVDRSVFPNEATFLGSYVANYGNAYPFLEQHDLFRFTIGRTF
ncbi:MAG TPA: outer membrane protein assembly factor BamA [Bryobacteraceae bacterium]|jgi:outer membrane protein insertion porin family|nr:outer membrane protein assembly factor BamA [Bryobacteraceae bacterium]